MEKNAIKKYAVWARRELIVRVAGKAASYGITQEDHGNANEESIGGRVLSSDERQQRAAFITKIDQEGYEQAIEEIAYTWFNRFCALRYMEVNGYLPSHVRVFTNDAGEFKPQILDEAIHLDLNGLDMEKVYAYKESDQTEELYRYLLIVQCNALNSILPGMFQQISDYTELLLPDNLLREGSVIEQMITQIPEEDWTDQVQIIGWLYQYYNAERKDEVFAALKKNVKVTKENIPAATQLFTPDWIVRYMVENSLGRLWVEGHPNEDLKKNWKYYLEEAQQEPDVEKQLSEIHKDYASLKPEDIKCIDPCCGSGHILVYMFDVLMQIYESYGYTAQDAVSSIVKNNLYGLDIDERAAQLSYFSVMMKARSYDKNFFNRGIQPNVYALRESEPLSPELLEAYGPCKDIVQRLVDSFADAKELGSLIEPNITLEEFDTLEKQMDEMDYMADTGSLNGALFTYTALEAVWPLLPIARILLQKYDVVVTNPPYMGAGNMNTKLNNYIKTNYPNSKSDLFSCFIERGNQIIERDGYNCMVTMQSWMFLSSFERMRKNILKTMDISNLMQMDNMVLGIAFGTAVTVFQNCHFNGYKGTYNYIKLSDIENDCPKEFPVKANRFAQVSTNNFFKIPGAPIAYWASKSIYNSFEHGVALSKLANPRKGLATTDNARFLRQWYEVNNNNIAVNCKSREEAMDSGSKWFPLNKGGEFRRWYGNKTYIINWLDDGIEIKEAIIKRYNGGSYTKEIRSEDKYFKDSITWSALTTGTSSFRFSDYGAIFDSAGSSMFPSKDIFYILGLLNTKVVNAILTIINPTLNYGAGSIANIPIIKSEEKYPLVETLVKDCIKISKIDWDSYEISWDFKRHPLICPVSNVSDAFVIWQKSCENQFNRLKANEEKLNNIFIDIYGLQDELSSREGDKDVTVRKADLQCDIKSLISYAVGCMFGRYSLDVAGLAYAGGEWDDSKYQTYKPDYNGILPICDDEYFTDDIVGHFIDFLRTVYGEDTLEENLKFIADALGGSGTPRQVIRKYFLNDFYKDHCKTYQKKPIYWLFDSGKKNGFKCLIYMHRYQPDTIARIRTDYVHEQQARYRTAMADLQGRIADASTSERIKLQKELTKIQDQADELQDYEEKIHHLADQFIDIDLDDGVKVNYAKFQDVLAKIQ